MLQRAHELLPPKPPRSRQAVRWHVGETAVLSLMGEPCVRKICDKNGFVFETISEPKRSISLTFEEFDLLKDGYEFDFDQVGATPGKAAAVLKSDEQMIADLPDEERELVKNKLIAVKEFLVLQARGVASRTRQNLAPILLKMQDELFAPKSLPKGGQMAPPTFRLGKYLNAPRVQRDRLYRAGIIAPRIRGGEHGAADQFAPEDLDAFLARLLDGAKPVRVAADGQVTIPQAAHRAFCMSEDVVRLVLDGKVWRKWKLAGEPGYMSLLLDLEEVRALVRGPDHGGLSGLQIKDKLSTTAKVAAALIKHGHLRTITVINPINRCPTVVVPAEEVERFEREYVSLFAIAKQRRQHFMVVKKELQEEGVEPVFNPEKIGASFYRRTDLAGIFA